MAIKLDVAKLFMDGRPSNVVEFDVPVRPDGQPVFGATITIDGCEFEYSNLDRNRISGYAVPRTYPTGDQYPHWIDSEGFWHPANETAKAAVPFGYGTPAP